MYRWTDPIEPDGVPRRPEPPTDEGPAWLTDRPEPRSSYLFGDEPGQSGPDRTEPHTGAWGADAPATPWRDDHTPERTGHLPTAGAGTHGWADAGRYADADRTGYSPAVEPPAYGPAAHPGGPYEQAPMSPYERSGGWRPEEQHTAWQQPVDERAGAWQPSVDERPGAWQPVADERPTGAWQPGTGAADDDTGRHRERRRLRRPLLIGGAAAAATLVVSLGVGALVLPDGDQPTEPTSADRPVAAAPLATDGAEDAPADALAPESASPSAAPTTARPTPSRKPTPKPTRTTAPSRQLPRSTAPSSTGATTASAKGLTAELREVVDLVNQERAKAGCKALTVDDKLTLAAQRHSQDQADHKKMSHDGSDGSDVGDRLDRVGYAWRSYGENVAWNQQSPAAVMDAWMNSPGHRANILNCSFTEIGVGVARSNGPYWTQDFGTPR
ncbi:serine protease [Micromonospora terminaliae]|uniref:Serine protease n=1 Tax=Micromonospora terminaliae TaxID=1914461 RepID=A0AAJ3DLV8_9ACTN|nr:CAP domain-containing protein [Micromonospora terminaliae]NES28535.1 serine protease [Micromonospora terminaliae]QGL45741.1 serine protease [Micromonospora terminaliae]